MLDTIKQKMTAKKRIIRDLLDQKRMLEHSQQELDQTLVYQAQLCTSLKEKVSQWRAQVELKLAQRIQEKKEYTKSIIKQVQYKTEWLQQNSIKRLAFPISIEKVHTTLQQRFTDERMGRQFINKIVYHLKKSTQ